MELQKYFSKFRIRQRKQVLSEEDSKLKTEISRIIGAEINDLELYREAFSLKNNSGKNKKNFERLEFLGDSILGSVISCYLYTSYPDANEGYLTQMKSKIVNRKNLNKLGDDLRLTNFLIAENTNVLSENIAGNLFEALIGAIYLDINYDACKKIILSRLMTPEEISRLEHKIVSYKGLLLEWSQKKKCSLRYETTEETGPNKTLIFRSNVWIGEQKISNATETSKKKAEEKAAQRAFYTLNKKENILEKPKTVSGS